MAAIRLVAGLGNPGPQYDGTRHNVGAEFVHTLSRRYAIPLAVEPRFKGRVGRGDIHGHEVRLLVPNTYMNLSGQSVGALASFFKIGAEEILVAHDEIAFPVGVVRLKIGGRNDSHNGIIDIVQALGNDARFLRLRIGVGHPGESSRVANYLTSTRMPKEEREAVARAMDLPDKVLASLLAGDTLKAMNLLHAPPPSPDETPPPEDGS